MRKAAAGLSLLIVLCQHTSALASQTPQQAPLRSIDAKLVSVDSTARQVSFVSASGATESLPVASAEALETLAKSKPGRKVVLECRDDGRGSCAVEKVKGKPNWLKRILLVTAAVVVVGAVVVFTGTE